MAKAYGDKTTVESLKMAHAVSGAGRSIREMIWEELDNRMDVLLGTSVLPGENTGIPGEARGLAIALSLMYNPYEPSVDAIREEAMERHQARQQ